MTSQFTATRDGALNLDPERGCNSRLLYTIVGPVTTRLPSTSSGPEHVEGSSSQAVPAEKTTAEKRHFSGRYDDRPYEKKKFKLKSARLETEFYLRSIFMIKRHTLL